MEARARLLLGLGVEERRVEVNGIGTTVLEGGDGPPLLLLHRALESPSRANWRASTTG
jgi:2-hydroxymuconate-semialdehyde hydrolase